jgi:hypothetical protein
VGKGTVSFLGWTKCSISKSGYRSQGAPAKPVKMATLHCSGFWVLAALVFDLRVSKHSTTWATFPALLVLLYFSDRMSCFAWPGPASDLDSPTSTSGGHHHTQLVVWDGVLITFFFFCPGWPWITALLSWLLSSWDQCFGGTEVLGSNPGLVIAKQGLYHLRHAPQSFFALLMFSSFCLGPTSDLSLLTDSFPHTWYHNAQFIKMGCSFLSS